MALSGYDSNNTCFCLFLRRKRDLPLFLSRGESKLSPFVLEVAMHIIRVRYTWRVAQSEFL
jgi:hypothetical protein